jgi:hypothetical protein
LFFSGNSRDQRHARQQWLPTTKRKDVALFDLHNDRISALLFPNQVTKDFDSTPRAHGAHFLLPTHPRRPAMPQKTCAACDCPLDDSLIKVKLGGKTVEVCCEECATKLKEAFVSASSPQ